MVTRDDGIIAAYNKSAQDDGDTMTGPLSLANQPRPAVAAYAAPTTLTHALYMYATA